MSITNAGNTLVINAAITATLDAVSYFAFKNSGGEFFRKALTDTEEINSTTTVYTCYLTEAEGNDTITGISLIVGGSITLETGTEIATQVVTIEKDNTQSLLVEWQLEVVSNV
jgi:hypothetical protein